MQRDSYIQKVVARLTQLLHEHQSALTVSFRIDGVRGTQTDWRLEIDLESDERPDEWFDCIAVLTLMRDMLENEFRGNEWFHGIQICLPHRFLGRYGYVNYQDALQQRVDNLTYRKIRLDEADRHMNHP